MEKEILRAQFDGKKQMWRIAKKTFNGAGGWKSFGSGAIYNTKNEAAEKIKFLVETNPGQYKPE